MASMVGSLHLPGVFYDVLSPTILIFPEGTSFQRLECKHTVMRISNQKLW